MSATVLEPQEIDLAAPAAGDITARSPLQLFLRRFRQDRVAMAAMVFIVLLILMAIFAPLIVKLIGVSGPYKRHEELLDAFGSASGPTSAHPFGVDDLGRDILARVIYGARVSLQVAFISTGIAVLIGVTIGTLAGFFRGWVDTLLSRVMDIILAFPILLLAIGLASACTIGSDPSNPARSGCLNMSIHTVGWIVVGAAVLSAVLIAARRVLSGNRLTEALFGLVACAVVAVFGLVLALIVGDNEGGLIQPGKTTLIVVIALSSWPYIGRIIRGQVLSLREKEFVDASRSLGASSGRIMRKEILPNLVAPIIVYSSLVLPTNILYEAALSFLGVGIQPPTASWGEMIAKAAGQFDTAWWWMVFPGAALVLTVLAFNLVGDGLQDALNPRANRS